MLQNVQANTRQVLVGMHSNNLPIVEVRSDNNNRVQMVGRPSGDSDPFFRVIADGTTVFKVDRNGVFGLTNGSDYEIGDDGIQITGVSGSSIFPPKAVRFFDTSSNLIGVYGATANALRIVAEPSKAVLLSSTSGAVNITATEFNIMVNVGSVNEMTITGLATSAPSGSFKVYRVNNFQGSGVNVLAIT